MEAITRLTEAFESLGLDEMEKLKALLNKTDVNNELKNDPESADNSGAFAFTDLGNAERFINQHLTDIRYNPIIKSWLIWDGKRWREDAASRIYNLARKTIRSIPKEADAYPDGDPRRAEVLKWAAKSESKERIKALVELAQHDPAIIIEPSELDQNQWLLNCLNGTLNLKTGEIQEHKNEDLITKLAPVKFNPEAICPKWQQFLNEIFQDNAELIRYIQKITGYSLTGSTKEQDFYLFYGTGANGKSTFIRIIMDLLGRDYAKQTAATALLLKQHETAGEEIAVLDGARLVATVEVDDGKRLAESLVKQLTGGDSVRVRRLYANSFEFIPTFKLIMVCNHKPRISGTDSGIWRRVKLVPFSVQIPEHRQDPDLAEKLKEELPGILNWCIEGCLKWQEQGLHIPEEVDAATTSYRVESDAIGAFMDECIITTNYNARTQAATLYKAYKDWTENAGEYSLSMRRFNDRLRDRGFTCHASTGNRKFWKGIGLIDSSMEDWKDICREIGTQ